MLLSMGIRGRYLDTDAAALDRAMSAANMNATMLARLLTARSRHVSCTGQYIRQLRNGQRVRVRAELAQAIEAVLTHWTPDVRIFNSDTGNSDDEQMSA